MKLVCFQTFTKIKFIFVVDNNTPLNDCDLIYRKIYDIYSDYVSKNPFYEVIAKLNSLLYKCLLIRLLLIY